MKKYFILLIVLILIAGCTYLPGKKSPLPGSKVIKSVIGGKGILVEFLAGNPPIDEINGPFNIILNFMSYGKNDINVKYAVGSTSNLEGFKNIPSEAVSIAGAEFDEADQSKFIGPGKIISAQVNGKMIRDNMISYGPYEFKDFQEGETTQFYIDMTADEYTSSAILQFCVMDLLSREYLGCQDQQNAPMLKHDDPVVVSSVVKTLSLESDNAVRVTLDIDIQDNSPKPGTRQGEAIVFGEVVKENNFRKVGFRIEPTAGGFNFECESKQQINPGRASYLELSIKDKTEVRCQGITTISEGEKRDFQYKIDLSYKYRQLISTPSITISGSRENRAIFQDVS